MMRRIIVVGWVAMLAVLNSVGAWAATEIGVEDLLSDPADFDQQTVSVVGELIGDYGFRGDGSAWSQLNGDSYATAPLQEGGPLNGSNTGIGVRAPAALLEGLDPPGDYRHRGPLVRATGIWRYHDEGRGGETYLDVASLEILERGRELGETADPAVIGTGVLLLLLALGLGYRARRRSIS
jgi:hypothetical protein